MDILDTTISTSSSSSSSSSPAITPQVPEELQGAPPEVSDVADEALNVGHSPLTFIHDAVVGAAGIIKDALDTNHDGRIDASELVAVGNVIKGGAEAVGDLLGIGGNDHGKKPHKDDDHGKKPHKDGGHGKKPHKDDDDGKHKKKVKP